MNDDDDDDGGKDGSICWVGLCLQQKRDRIQGSCFCCAGEAIQACPDAGLFFDAESHPSTQPMTLSLPSPCQTPGQAQRARACVDN